MTCPIERTLRRRKRNRGHRHTEMPPSAGIFDQNDLLAQCTNISSLEVGFDGNEFCSRWFAFGCCCHVRKLSARREDKGKDDKNGT